MRQVAVLGRQQEDQPIDEAQQLAEILGQRQRAAREALAQCAVVGVGEEAAAKAEQRRLDPIAQALAGGHALLAARLAPTFEGAIGRRRAGHAETAGVEQEPQSGEIGERLALENRAQIRLDESRPCQAGIVAHEAELDAVAAHGSRLAALASAAIRGRPPPV